MFKIPKQEYTPEFKELAVKRLKGGERVERLMRENKIGGRNKQRFKATTDAKHSLRVAPNLLNRNFTPVAPNQAWRADLDPRGCEVASSGPWREFAQEEQSRQAPESCRRCGRRTFR